MSPEDILHNRQIRDLNDQVATERKERMEIVDQIKRESSTWGRNKTDGVHQHD